MTTIWITLVVVFVAMALTAGIAGRKRGGTVWAIFIDSRDTWSLTQFQLVVWTFAIIPFLVAIVIGRAMDEPMTAWNLTVPGPVLALVGISVGSTATAGVIKSQKNQADNAPLAAGTRILTRADASKARVSDMLAYDEGKGALTHIDVTKFQNLILTLAIAVTYAWSCFSLIANAGSPSHIGSMPDITGLAVGLLGVSHAGYLTGKVIPQSGDPDIVANETDTAVEKFAKT